MKLSFLIFLYFLNCINSSLTNASSLTTVIYNNVFQIQDLTENKILDGYPEQPGPPPSCSFQLDYLASCINDGGENGYPLFLFISNEVNPSILGQFAQNRLVNSTSVLYSVFFNLFPSSNRILTNITLSGCGYSGVESVIQNSLQCHEVNVSSLKFEISDLYYSELHQYHSILRIGGLLYPLTISSLSSLGGGYYLFSSLGYSKDSNIEFYDSYTISNISFSIQIGSQTIPFSILPNQGLSSTSQISDINLYPSDLNDTSSFIQQYKCYPITTFKIKSDLYPPLLFRVNNGVYNVPSYTYMYGESDGSLVYYESLDYRLSSYPDPNLYFFAQNGNQFKSFLNLNLKMDEIQIYPQTFNLVVVQVDSGLIFSITASNTKYDFLPLYFTYTSTNIFDFPFGFSSGSLNSFNFEAGMLYSNNSIAFTYGSLYGTHQNYQNIISKNTLPLILNNIEVKLVSDYHYSIQFQISSEGGVSLIDIYGTYFGGMESLIYGTIYDGVFECVISLISGSINNINIYDTNLQSLNIPIPYYYSINPVKFFNGVKGNDITVDSVSSIYFDSYEMDITDSEAYNTMYIDFNGNKSKYSFGILFTIDAIDISDCYSPVWDDVKMVYYIKFSLQKNKFPSQKSLQWILISLPSQAQIVSSAFNNKLKKPCAVKSLTPDVSGPMVTNIAKLAGGIVNLNDAASSQSVGWNITIEDKINGFSNGYIIAQGLVDGSTYNFTLNSQKAEKSITFTLLLSNISCVDQAFQINRVELYDTANKKSGYSNPGFSFSEDPNGYNVFKFNALMNYNNDLDILRVNVSCTPSTADTSGPELLSIIPNTQSVDVGSNDRSIEFTLKVQDLQSGINVGQSPIVYITSDDFKQVECKSSLVICSNNDIECTFKCKTELPYAFTFSKQILYQVYGIWNKNGIFSGYSYGKLSSIGINSIINSTFSRNIPVITKTNKVTNEPNSEILIIGNAIGNATLVIINFDNGTKSSATPICDSPLYCIIQFAGTSQPFTIQIQLKDNSLSNVYKIKPYIVGSFDYISSSSSSTTSSSASCPGQPVCGGPSNGICTSKGCVCISPWFGVECKQKIIIIPQPSFNNTDPNITIIVPNENNSNQIEFTSLTSIVSLREINIYNEPINIHPFSLWYNNQINSTLNEYYSNFTNINNMGKTTQVKVSVQWFSNQTNIEFAGNQLIMNPSSIKYTIEIKDYPFKSNLNSLEIVMSALFQSNQDKSCSSKEFGDTNEYEDSNYLKLQVNDHSLYARFIKRGIIDDNRTVPISNRLLDSNFTTIDQASTTQSYIGITIQHFDNIAIVDPDFSVMLDYSKSSNSICNNSSKLTSTQIAGIVIGCVGFVAVIAISFIVYYIRKKRNAREMKNLSNKLKNLS